jgi:phosphatidylglycerol:prolipoprotein diacylglycerol transferase
MADAHWVHNIDPYAIRLWGDFGIRWYGISYLVGIAWGWWMLKRWAKAGRLPMTADAVGDFIVTIAMGMVIGGRLGYAAFYEPSLFVTCSSSLPWWKLLAVHQGGMASHGGIIGIAAATWWYARRRNLDMAVLGDALAAVSPFGIACGRVANFVNGELWGKPSDVPWAVVFPDDLLRLSRHPSQLYAVFLEGLLVLAVLLPLHARHRRPGLTIGAFFILYGIGRFVGECFREPDAGQPGFDAAHPAILGFMSKGQAYTIPLLILGVILVVWTLRRPARPDAYSLPER